MTVISVNATKIHNEKISIACMVILHLLPGALAMLLIRMKTLFTKGVSYAIF